MPVSDLKFETSVKLHPHSTYSGATTRRSQHVHNLRFTPSPGFRFNSSKEAPKQLFFSYKFNFNILSHGLSYWSSNTLCVYHKVIFHSNCRVSVKRPFGMEIQEQFHIHWCVPAHLYHAWCISITWCFFLDKNGSKCITKFTDDTLQVSQLIEMLSQV